MSISHSVFFFVTSITELSHTSPSFHTRFHSADVSLFLHQVERPEGAGLQPLSNYVRFFTSKLNRWINTFSLAREACVLLQFVSRSDKPASPRSHRCLLARERSSLGTALLAIDKLFFNFFVLFSTKKCNLLLQNYVFCVFLSISLL